MDGLSFTMPKKERIQKRKEKERQEAAKGSRPLNAWLKPSTSTRIQERPQTSESVTPEREAETLEATPEREEEESVEATPERKEALDATPDTEEAIEIPVNVGEEESTGREADDATAEEAIDEGEVEGATSDVGEEVLSNIALLKYPTDPAHQQAFDLKCYSSYVKMCVDRGPCQPDRFMLHCSMFNIKRDVRKRLAGKSPNPPKNSQILVCDCKRQIGEA
ncbi:uncharacterized protein LOC133647156 [Entelurus aequoreus]|uniref:uncharacterized protein LOC133647156 n=1 Tax=Entelurus aequoreus TaxID=161455 RepID=UPI002B1CF856|nr:uncharacterized protein LOC133647156 [Entelurus aequoreus]